ncbi:acetyl-CoA synthetase, partial [Enteropsectra breve]
MDFEKKTEEKNDSQENKKYSYEYEKMLYESNPMEFWKEKANFFLSWSRPFTKIYNNDFGGGRWFEDGSLNACYNCIDRWVGSPNAATTAIIFNDNFSNTLSLSYKDALNIILQISNALKYKFNLKKGDCVTLYLSMSHIAVLTALACSRLGITHNVVFGGFSPESLKLRILDSNSKLVISQLSAFRGNKKIEYSKNVYMAVKELGIDVMFYDEFPAVEEYIDEMIDGTGSMHNNSDSQEQKINTAFTSENSNKSSDARNTSYDSFLNFSKMWSDLRKSKVEEFIPCMAVEAEHPLFYLYTSGSTGKPKGLIHSTGGYLLYAAYSLSTVFDIKRQSIKNPLLKNVENIESIDRKDSFYSEQNTNSICSKTLMDIAKNETVFCCTADIGWITGHSYSVYGPLALGLTTVVFEGLPSHPTFFRYFEVIEKYKITHFYTAPTVIRILKSYFDENINIPYDLSTLRMVGSVGEPINSETYQFYSKISGNKTVVDTYFQTETGGIIIAPIYGVKDVPPECAGLAVPGIKIVQKKNESETNVENAASGQLGRIYIEKSWPGIARGILNDRERFLRAYFSEKNYFTGDEGNIDAGGDIWIKGRADDVINVSGHRISTAEVESAAGSVECVAESAVVAIGHKIKGQSMVLFVVLKNSCAKLGENEVKEKIRRRIGEIIGRFCLPEEIFVCEGIPKTSTGKIMRRVLRAVLQNEELGDLSTCINPEII